MALTNFLVKLVKVQVTDFSPEATDSPKMHQKDDFETLDPRFIYWICSVITSIFWIYLRHNSKQLLVKLVKIQSYGFSLVANNWLKMRQKGIILKHWTQHLFSKCMVQSLLSSLFV